jgi:hypothetical protein
MNKLKEDFIVRLLTNSCPYGSYEDVLAFILQGRGSRRHTAAFVLGGSTAAPKCIVGINSPDGNYRSRQHNVSVHRKNDQEVWFIIWKEQG